MPRFQLEICVDSLAGALIAYRAGATRIELSNELEVGGVTPDWELLRSVCREVPLPVIALIRCRPGNFLYSPSESNRMLEEARVALACGASGVAVGALRPSRSGVGDRWMFDSPKSPSLATSSHLTYLNLDWEYLERIASSLPTTELVIHRAFDSINEQVDALKRLRSLGFRRVLTSGGPATAFEGREQLKKLVETEEIEILPAGGIRLANAKQLIAETGCLQLHGSFRRNASKDPSSANGPELPDEQEIAQLAEYLQALSLRNA